MKPVSASLGFYAALVAFIAASGYSVVQLLQVSGVLRFPWDEILIYGFSLCIAIPYMLAMLALYYTAPGNKKLWSHAALLLAILYAVYATFVYTVQLGVALPKMIRGEEASIQVLVLTEHSFFWTLDAVAYICLGLSTLFAAFVFANTGFQKWLRWFFLANALLTPVVALVYFYPHFSIPLLFLASPWIITTPGALLLLALYFRRQLNRTRMSLLFDSEEALQILAQ
jgi:hypothetical protein